MEFQFFDARDEPIFVRNDAETATWTVEEMTFQATFPFNPDKEITRGMRVGFTDSTGVFQTFEIRKVATYEPDHYQQFSAEHIVISELTDEHYHGETFSGTELTDVSAASALATALTGTLWSVGNDTTQQELSSGDLGVGSVWQCVNTIKSNWNVYITPRVTFNASGITGRYLDIAPATGVWTGIRFSLEKNLNDAAVTIDDSETVTALYGYGANTDDDEPLSFSDVVWTATADHPAKPQGQKYLEDPTATQDFGRNGRARYGYYQNTDIDDADVLIEKTWETLKTASKPKVTISGTVHDLKRLGYADQPIVLHGIADVEITQTSYTAQLEIVQLTVDLLNPLETRVTIGEYIPNIVYIQRDTATKAGGGGGGGSGHAYGAVKEEKRGEFYTSIARNNYLIQLAAYQADLAGEILRAAGISIDASGVAVYAQDYAWNVGSKFEVVNQGIASEVTNRTNADNALSSRITQNADSISLVVTGTGANAAVNTASIVTAINNAGSSVEISADKILLNGSTTVSSILTGTAAASKIQANTLECLNLNCSTTNGFTYNGRVVHWQQQYVLTGLTLTMPVATLSGEHDFIWQLGSGQSTSTGRILLSYSAGSVTGPTGKTIYYLGDDGQSA